MARWFGEREHQEKLDQWGLPQPEIYPTPLMLHLAVRRAQLGLPQASEFYYHPETRTLTIRMAEEEE